MKKFCCFILLALCISFTVAGKISKFPTKDIITSPPSTTFHVAASEYGLPPSDADFTELYVSFATGIFDFIAKLIRTKIDLYLGIDRFLIQFLVPKVIKINTWIYHHPDTIQNAVSTALNCFRLVRDWVHSNQAYITAVVETITNVLRILTQKGTGWHEWGVTHSEVSSHPPPPETHY